MKIATLNCNGIRSCLRRGFAAWLAQCRPDVLCLQEVRAFPADLGAWACDPAGYQACWRPATKPGYSGVAIFSRQPAVAVVSDFGDAIFDEEGRWLEVHFDELIVISLYLHSGTSSQQRQAIKYQAMELLAARFAQLERSGKDVVVAGDFNIAHTEKDIRNWRGNRKNSGFLPEERQWFTELLASGLWVDVFRTLEPEAEKYTWWSQRAGSRRRDVGWRIDYQIATRALAERAVSWTIDREPEISDHAPFAVSYRR